MTRAEKALARKAARIAIRRFCEILGIKTTWWRDEIAAAIDLVEDDLVRAEPLVAPHR